jgi:hypothetical protein
MLTLAVPALWYPGQDSEEIDLEITQMMDRAVIANKVESGTLDHEDYLDLLSDQGYLVDDILNAWGNGELLA